MPPFFVRYRKKAEKRNWLWGPRFDHIETSDGRIYFDQGRETGPLQTRYRDKSERVFAEKRREQEARGMRGPGTGPDPDRGPGRGRGHGGPHGGPHGGGHGGGHGGPPGGHGGRGHGGPLPGGHGGGPGEMRGPGAGPGGGFVYGGGHGGMGGPGPEPRGPGIQRGHGPGGREPSIDGEEPRSPGAGRVDTAISDDESSVSSHGGEDANPIQANGEFDPRHQFNVPPGDHSPRGSAARAIPHDNRRSRGTPEGWNPNVGGGAARMAGRGGSGYTGEHAVRHAGHHAGPHFCRIEEDSKGRLVHIHSSKWSSDVDKPAKHVSRLNMLS